MSKEHLSLPSAQEIINDKARDTDTMRKIRAAVREGMEKITTQAGQPRLDLGKISVKDPFRSEAVCIRGRVAIVDTPFQYDRGDLKAVSSLCDAREEAHRAVFGKEMDIERVQASESNLPVFTLGVLESGDFVLRRIESLPVVAHERNRYTSALTMLYYPFEQNVESHFAWDPGNNLVHNIHPNPMPSAALGLRHVRAFTMPKIPHDQTLLDIVERLEYMGRWLGGK